MNAKRLIMTLVFAAILIGFVVWMTWVAIRDVGRKNRIWQEQAQKVTQAAEVLNDRKIDIMVYGDEWKGPKNLVCRMIYDLNDDTLIGDENVPEHNSHMIVINDQSGTADLSDTVMKRLLFFLKNDSYILVYLGSEQIPKFQEAGLFFDVYPSYTKSLIFWNKGASYEIGFADDPMLLPEVVREQIDRSRFPALMMVMKMAQNKRYFSE